MYRELIPRLCRSLDIAAVMRLPDRIVELVEVYKRCDVVGIGVVTGVVTRVLDSAAELVNQRRQLIARQPKQIFIIVILGVAGEIERELVAIGFAGFDEEIGFLVAFLRIRRGQEVVGSDRYSDAIQPLYVTLEFTVDKHIVVRGQRMPLRRLDHGESDSGTLQRVEVNLSVIGGQVSTK